jgi:tetratricopeptide (TPR) repeat protein
MARIEKPSGRASTDIKKCRGVLPNPKVVQALQQAQKLCRLGQRQQAAQICQQILAADPNNLDASHLLGVIAHQLGDHDGAATLLKRVLKARPKSAQAHLHLGLALAGKGDLARAVACYQQAIHIEPRNAQVHFSLGNAYRSLGRRKEAIASYRRAIEAKSDFVEALSNLGGILQEACDFEEAVDIYERALSIRPHERLVRRNLGTLQLLLGRFKEGWRNYLARGSMEKAPDDFFREILPRDLTGKRVLVVRDQGLGDEIFFLRFLPAVAQRGASVSYRSDPRLVAMLERAAIAVIVRHEVSVFDLELSVGDLPYVLGVTDEMEIPPTISLAPISERVESFSRRLNDFGPPPYIGVTWRAGTGNNQALQFREAPIVELARLLASLKGQVVVIQRNPKEREVADFEEVLGRPVLDLTAHNDDLEDMLALVSLFDEYVCVDNTNVHLRSALGKPSRVLVPLPTEFRWMSEGPESPWFVGSRAYRQSPDGDWSTAFSEIERDLKRG